MSRVFRTPDEVHSAVGQHLGYSGWLDIDQARIDAFAVASGDHQWIHVDAERATTGPYGATVAHGYLTLALLPVLVREVVEYAGWRTRINYGSDKVRFPTAVLVDSRVRAGVEVMGVRPTTAGLQVINRVTVEISRDATTLDRPALVAETITLLIE